MEYTIDVENKSLGRAASEIALILQGKRSPDFNPRLAGNDKVIVKNIEKIKITGKKKEQKIYYSHSGRPGGLKKKKMGGVFDDSPAEVLRITVGGMLPKNKLKKDRLKRLLIISENQNNKNPKSFSLGVKK